MIDFLTPSNITFVLGLLAIIFSVYNYFKNPQIRSEKIDALLQQRIQWDKESTTNKFKELQDNFYLLLKQNDNHLHTIEDKLNQHIIDNTQANLTAATNFTKIFTLIEERIPCKK